MLISGHPVHTFSECIWPYTCTYIIYDAHASEIYVTRDGYSRLGFICVHPCGSLSTYARTNKSQQQPQSDTYPKSLPFASGCQQNLLNTINDALSKSGSYMPLTKKERKLSKKIYVGEARRGCGQRLLIFADYLSKSRFHVYTIHLNLSTILHYNTCMFFLYHLYTPPLDVICIIYKFLANLTTYIDSSDAMKCRLETLESVDVW